MRQAEDVVLLVEDEPFVALVAQQMLEDDGFTVLVASDGAGALEIAGRPSQPVAIAVVDLGLPDMRGDELVDQIRAHRPLLPVVIASGYSTRELEEIFRDRDQARLSLIGKPYDGAGLRQAMQALGIGTTRG